ncbi:Cholinesterase [Dactylellina cionopaga]|nr:Cholinesterase [Dactylellina cionopaga]
MANYKTFTHNHPTLGSLTGRLVESDTIVHFRSIPYATIPARFRPSNLLSSIPENFDHRPHRNFTEYGYACPSRPQDFSGLPDEKPREYDEFKCLCLTISAIKSSLDAISTGSIKDINHLRKSPVLVYIHGGAFTEGAGHISAFHETIRLAGLSVQEETPTILVSIGYRLGAFAGLMSQDLLDEARENGDEDIFNQGLFDQRKALTWIKKFIGGFGGDEDRVTVFGESAGSISIALHLVADEPLFYRCAMQSGNTATSSKTVTWGEVSKTYDNLLQYIGVKWGECEKREERLERLRNVPQEELWQAWINVGAAIMEPYFGPEGTFFKKLGGKPPTYTTHAELTAKRDWLDSAIVGDDFFEGYIFRNGLQHAKYPRFVKVFKEVFGAEQGSKILAAYDIEPNEEKGMDHVKFFMRLMYLIGDIYFQEPTAQMADILSEAYNSSKDGGRKKKVFRYQFCLPNLFPGTPYSFVTGHHFVEMFYQFMTFRERFPTHRNKFYQRQSEQMARMWIAFANDKDPWDEYKKEDGYKIEICDDINGWHTRTREEDMEKSQDEPWGERRYKQWDMLKEAFEKIAREGGEEKLEWARRKMVDKSSMTDEDFTFTFAWKQEEE